MVMVYIAICGIVLFLVTWCVVKHLVRRRDRNAVTPAGPTVAAAPAQVVAAAPAQVVAAPWVAPAFDPPLAGGGQFCASCGQVPTPCLVLQDFVRLLLALAYAYQRDARAAKTAGGQVLHGAAAANTRSFALLASRTAPSVATAAPGAS